MANLLETFVTMTHQDYNWPYPKPLISKPAPPPMNTGERLYLPRSDPNDCKCDAHSLEIDKIRYKQLAGKENQLQRNLVNVNREMANLTSRMLESTCETDDETMKSIYETDYKQRGFPIASYKPLIAAIDSPVRSPITPVVTELKNGYRDPTRFRYSAIERPDIQPAKPINLLAVPGVCFMWDEPFTGRSEYMDTISKMGLSNMKNRQQYLEPMPSSRRRFGDCTR